ncbi:cadmium-translocating P-type ATPase [Rhodobacteraceae bacterium CCMM004]|nr:cadmium-translocating P-type ATPase [Rhodobacteraceae bacterium CCMM004]
MTLAETPSFAACPGCVIAPAVRAAVPDRPAELILALPGIHCAACIGGVEAALAGLPQVEGSRVNLSRRQVSVWGPRGMAPEPLVEALEAAGFEALPMDRAALDSDRDPAGRALMVRLAVAGFAMMNVMLLSVAVWSGATDATRDMFHWISAAIALPAVAFAGQPFYAAAWTGLKARRLVMEVPISLALILAVGLSVYETAMSGRHAYFDAALSLTFFLLIARYLDHRTRAAARSAAADLAALEVPRVERLTTDGAETVDLAALRVGDVVRVRPGGRIPADGMVMTGRSDLDRALLTGESLPAAVAPGGAVAAGEVNLTGPLEVRVTAVGADTALNRMVTMIDAAETARNRYTAMADRAARVYAPVVHILAFAAFAAWMVYDGDLRHALNVAIATLIITCPCALGLAVPAVSTAAAGRLFRQGMLVKDGTALERLADIDTVVFDKTGTLTDGLLRLGDVPQGTAAGVALALAQGSDHPVSRALAAGLLEAGVVPADVADISEHPGQGLMGRWQGREVRLGSPAWTGAAGSGPHLSLGDGAAVPLPLESRLRDGARALVDAFRAQGLKIEMISGDAADAVAEVARALGIDTALAGLSPMDKVAHIRALEEAGAQVLMVGDGLNDTGALAAATASVSPARAVDAARTAADVVILQSSLAPLSDLLTTARSAKKRVKENFRISAGYNAIAIPLAVAGFASPLMAAVAMSTSSITVLLNALRLVRRAPVKGAA